MWLLFLARGLKVFFFFLHVWPRTSIYKYATHLTISLVPSLVSLAQVKVDLVPVRLIETLDNVECTLAQCLAHWVEEHENKFHHLTYKEMEWWLNIGYISLVFGLTVKVADLRS